MPKELFSDLKKAQLYQLSCATRWDYLASPEFQVRNRIISEEIQMQVTHISDMKVLEIGGNPNPIIANLVSNIDEFDGVIVDPFISPIAREKYGLLEHKGIKVVQHMEEAKNESYDLVVILGVDLSLSDNFARLIQDLGTLREIISRQDGGDRNAKL